MKLEDQRTYDLTSSE